MKTSVSNPVARVVFVAFLGVSALFGNAAYAVCKYTNGNPLTGPIDNGKHCSRGYLVPDGQDFCERGYLSNHQPKQPVGIGGMTLSANKHGKEYAIGKAKCIPGGLIVLDGWNWCELDPKGKVNGEVIREGQLCRGTIIQPLPPSN